MTISVPSLFTDAQNADVNQIATKVQLLLGNYASAAAYGTTVVSSGDDASGNYPASGAIDGDRTELNIGAASASDNDIGLSSWKSAVAPDTTPQTLTFTFSQSRTINRIKLYHLANHGLKTYKLSYWNGASWVDFAATSDIVTGGQVSITTLGTLDTVDFPDISTTKLLLTISHTQVPTEVTNVVEFEVYRVVDITTRVKSVSVDRSRDYKMAQPIASQVSLVLDNTDRFFSFSHVPTSAEITAGFVNSELLPNIGVVVQMGFELVGVQTLATQFTGLLDKIVVKPSSREAEMVARDYMKPLINKTISTKLKTSTDISNLIKYLLNLGNISTFETSVDTSGIVIDNFFTSSETIISTIRNLVQACGDAGFWFDETGIATFKMWLNSVPLNHIDTVNADFNAGTLLQNITDGITANSFTRRWFLLDDFEDGNYVSNPHWSVIAGNPAEWSVYHDAFSYRLRYWNVGPGAVGDTLRMSYATGAALNTGSWHFTFRYDPTPYTSGQFQMYFLGNASTNGYFIWCTGAELRLCKGTYSVNSVLGNYYSTQNDGSFHTILVTRDGSGVMNVYLDGTLRITATDTAYSTGLSTIDLVLVTALPSGPLGILWDDFYYSREILTPSLPITRVQSIFESQVVDQGATINIEGHLEATLVVPSGCSAAWYTATSADGLTFDAWQPVLLNGPIISTPKRYIKYRVVFTVPQDTYPAGNANLSTPTVYDVTIYWFVNSGTSKFPTLASFTFTYEQNLFDIAQELTDSLGGDTAIINDVLVQARPFILTGANSDTQWQATVNVPAVPVSAGAPINVVAGQTLTYRPNLNAGMDITNMAGASPSAAVVTFGGGAAGTWRFASIHPTKPVLEITITTGGTITDLRIIGKVYSNSTAIEQQRFIDSLSDKLYGNRQQSISNQWIINKVIALAVATRLVENYKVPFSIISSLQVRPTFSVQLGDRITVIDTNADVNADYIVAGINHKIAASMDAAQVSTDLTVIKIPI
jgi:hypothetical protein